MAAAIRDRGEASDASERNHVLVLVLVSTMRGDIAGVRLYRTDEDAMAMMEQKKTAETG